jgi:uncharacterized protein (UPF0262 family)
VDLRNNNTISTETGQALARDINANCFIESSAKDNLMIKEVFYEAVRASVTGVPLHNRSDHPNCCCLC